MDFNIVVPSLAPHRALQPGLSHRVRPELAIGPARDRTRWAGPMDSAKSGRPRHTQRCSRVSRTLNPGYKLRGR